MTIEDFHKSIALAKSHSAPLTIGGGEPTLHPLFKEFLFHAMWEMAGTSIELDMPAVHMVTNGSNTNIALTLADLAQRGVIGCHVSHDRYHDPIDPRVYKAFKVEKEYYSGNDSWLAKPRNEFDCRGINGEQGYIIPAGRAKGWGNHPSNKCGCDSLFVHPTGKVYPCGCRKTSLGNISDLSDINPDYFEGNCEKSQAYKIMVRNHLELQEA
jgi:MoaA/NifB/PqqE/SkfB family radical SAM enzyme